MGITQPKILFGKVMHGRLLPKRNNFSYGLYNIALPLSHLDDMPLAHNRFAALSFYDSDHGDRNGDDLESWAREILSDYKLDDIANGEITLICMPRVIGYVFNPVSFWICHDLQDNVRAVLCEVHNTFGEQHTYLCAPTDGRVIDKSQSMTGEKLFHVSPFLEREGHYNFRFNFADNAFQVWIDYYNPADEKMLATFFTGDMSPMTASGLRKAFWRYPLVTLKAIMLIHWQAIKLMAKGIQYISKPKQYQKKISAVDRFQNEKVKDQDHV